MPAILFTVSTVSCHLALDDRRQKSLKQQNFSVKAGLEQRRKKRIMKHRQRRGKNQSISYKNFLSSFTFYICRSIFFCFCFLPSDRCNRRMRRKTGTRQRFVSSVRTRRAWKMLYCHYNSKFEFFANSFVVKMAQRVFASTSRRQHHPLSLLHDKFPISEKLFHLLFSHSLGLVRATIFCNSTECKKVKKYRTANNKQAE